MDVTVLIGTFGDESWCELAQRARASVPDGVPVVHVHGDTLHGARNEALARSTSEFVCFLDADDELEPGYLDFTPRADVNVPTVSYVSHGRGGLARFPRVAGHSHDCVADCLAFGNWIVIGAVARRQLLVDVGAFEDWPVYEDWQLWAKCWQAGASFGRVPSSVYRAHVRPDSRNRGSLSQREKHAVHQAIAEANGLPVPA